MLLYLLAIFGKNEEANISAQEKKILAKLIKQLVASFVQHLVFL